LRYRLRDTWRLFTSTVGRRQLAVHLYSSASPFFHLAASTYRRTLARRVRLLAIVGSYGKTTTRAATSRAMAVSHAQARTKGRSQVPMSLLRIPYWYRHGVLEVSINRKRQMERHARTVRPDIVILTSIGSEHNRSLGSLDDTLREKARILDGLRKGGVCVVNGDDEKLRTLEVPGEARVVTFGLRPENDVRASDLRLDWPHGTRFRLHMAGETHEVRVPLLGEKMAYAVLAAIAVATAEGNDLEDVLARLETMEPPPGRLQPVRLPNGAYLLRDDHKSSLETIDTALDVLSEIPARRIVVLGDISEPPGSQGPIYRRIGERLAGIATRIIIVGGHATREYATGATKAGFPSPMLVNAGKSYLAAVDAVREDLSAGDVVLIKGRNTQRLERIAFSLQDRSVGCELVFCRAVNLRCGGCPMLETGWKDQERARIVGGRF